MTLNNKLAFEIWVGIVVLVIVIGGIAGVTLMIGSDATSSLTRTQTNNPVSKTTAAPAPLSTPFASEKAIDDAAIGVTGALLGGATQ